MSPPVRDEPLTNEDEAIKAVAAIIAILKPLDVYARTRVLRAVCVLLNISFDFHE